MATAQPDDSDETWFSLLGPTGDLTVDLGSTGDLTVDLGATGDLTVDDARLRQLYAYPQDPDRCVVLANFIASLDGGSTVSGTSGGLGGPGDRRLFALLRELADVIVVGAGTAKAENYAGAKMTAFQRQRRQQCGQGEVPPIAVVTRTADLAHDLPVLVNAEVPTMVLTCADAAPGARRRLATAAEVIDCSGDDPGRVDLAIAMSRLADRGLLRVLTEGGPTLLGTFVAQGMLDELCLTCAPMLVGGNAVRLTGGVDLALTRMRPMHVLTDVEGYLYLRYVRVP
jgi:5-amino-6-(5-phosphoribosylamino)uracil reductase